MNKQNQRIAKLPVILLFGVLSISVQSVAAEGTYACHVVTKQNRQDVVFVQTDDKSKAAKSALQAHVVTNDQVKIAVAKVIECIMFPKERFTSYSMQQYVKKLPR